MISTYCRNFITSLGEIYEELPWKITAEAPSIIQSKIKPLGAEYVVRNSIAIHRNAHIEEHVTLKGPLIISAGCFIGAHAYLRGGVFLGEKVGIGPGCEVKSSFILDNSTLAHFNFIGDSIIGSHVNMEAGSVIANHYNEREKKDIDVLVDGKRISTASQKFGALVGDETKIGANAVLSPGTILLAHSIVRRLELVEQCPMP
ncbi:MAG: LpxA family transferase [Cyclobacteriaceae bacterium]|nr:LpxA family transferase [Cyclobacteriaceae bacterium]